MKFRITSKDLIIFIIFCILLLYLCAIGVMNFVTFGAEGKLWGLNPIPAFIHYFGITMVMFIVVLIMIFSSVSSYIFEKEKGVGLKIGEKEVKGYATWGTEKQMMNGSFIKPVLPKSTTIDAAGVPLIYKEKNKTMWVDNGEYHTLVIGSSGSGKTRCVVKPLVNLLAKHGESMILTDPKGEIYADTANYLKDMGYKVVVLNFREPANGNAWNPLTLPYQYMKMGNKDKATELLDDVALNILYDPNNKGEPFWEKSAADFFSGLALGLFEDAKQDEINLNSINIMSTVGEEKLGTSNYTKEYFTMKGPNSGAYIFANNTINAPSETKGGIMSTFRQKIRIFASRESLSEMLSYTDFNMLDIGKEKTAIFIIIHDEKTTYHSLATIFIKQCYETLIDVAQQNGGKLPYRTNFILDEFANMPPLKDVDSMVTAARSRLIRFTFIIQNFAQLNDVYGKEVAEVIRGNCGNTIYLISTELAALEEISKMCGEVKSKDKDKTASTPLITITDLQKMKFPDALILRARMAPYKTKLPLNDKVDWGYAINQAKYVSREVKPVQIFDIKAFVKAKKQEKMLNENPGMSDNPFAGAGMGGFDGLNGFGGMSGSNPFGGGMNPFGNDFSPKPAVNDNPFGGSGNNFDIDAMMRDIDKKLAELDAEEARQKEEDAKKKVDIEMPKIEAQPTIAPEKKEAMAGIVHPQPKVEPNKVVKENDDILLDMSANNSHFFDDFALPSKESVLNEKKMEQKPKVESSSVNLDSLNANKESASMPRMENKENNQNGDKPKVNVDVDSIIVNNNVISDDEFFDDFFGEDDK